MHRHGDPLRHVTAPRSPFYQGPFGRIFPDLDPWVPPGADDAARDDNLRDLAQRMQEPEGASNDPKLDNPDIPAGYTYFGQFVDHDITFDPTSSLQRRNDPARLRNFRTPRFDLDNLYGAGRADSPFLFDRRSNNDGKFLIGKGREIDPNMKDEDTDACALQPTDEADLPRNEQGIALIGDPRNDENILVSQVQLAFLHFHNQALDWVKDNEGLEGDAAFRRAQQLVRWHYQWVVLHDFLPRLVGRDLVEHLLPGRGSGYGKKGKGLEYCPYDFRLCFYKWRNQPFMPVEFSVAAYRLGHSMVRADYALNDALEELAGRIPIFKPQASEPGPLEDLRGGRFLPRIWTVQWERFLEIDGSDPQRSRLLDTLLNRNLSAIPPERKNFLAFLNLKRAWRLELPSGQDVARAMGATRVYTNEELELEAPFTREAPLWYYILKEAEIEGKGTRLGTVGARIVAEVFVGLAKGDPRSYLNLEPRWQPVFPKEGKHFELRDIFRFAGRTGLDIS